MQGFRARQGPLIDLGIGRSIDLTLDLEVAGIADSVEVIASSIAVDASTTATRRRQARFEARRVDAAKPIGDLVHHSDRGTQHLSIRHTERLADAGIELSVGSRGDAYDNALAETVIGLFKTEVIRRRGPWRSLEAVEFATLEWVDWFNHRRLLEPIGLPRSRYDSVFARHHSTANSWTAMSCCRYVKLLSRRSSNRLVLKVRVLRSPHGRRATTNRPSREGRATREGRVEGQ